MAVSITRTHFDSKEEYQSFGPEVGSVVRFSAQPYHGGTMEVISVDVAHGQYTGDRFHIVGRALAGSTTVSRLFGASSSRSCEGEQFELYCYGPAQDGGWDYVYPV